MKIIKKFFLYIWQFPQNIIGLLVYLVNIKSVKKVYNSSLNCFYYTAKHVSDKGVSLGKYIFLDYDNTITLDTIRHEKGHQKQSLYLGLFYLFIIGFPSLCGNILHGFIDFDYYRQPWEAWADNLGSVKR